MPRRIGLISADARIKRANANYVRRAFSWIDPFPEMHGTVPEKMVYAELTRMGIPFLFLNDIRFQIPEIDFDQWYQADFVIPSLKLIIEVQGAYWHSKPATIDADAYKFAIYQTTGYKALAWWDFDIIAGVHDLFLAEPLLAGAMRPGLMSRSTELPVQRRTKVDTSKGIRTLNMKRSHAKSVKVGRRQIRKAIGFYAT